MDRGWWILLGLGAAGVAMYVTSTSTSSRPAATKPVQDPLPSTMPQLQGDARSSAIATMQFQLNALGYPVMQITGTWTDETQRAYSAFVSANVLGLTAYAGRYGRDDFTVMRYIDQEFRERFLRGASA